MSGCHTNSKTSESSEKKPPRADICPACSLKCPLNTPSCEQGQRYADEQKKQEDNDSK